MGRRDLLDTNVAIEGQAQEYRYGELDTDVALLFTRDGISIYRGIGAPRSKTEYACFSLEVIVLSLPPGCERGTNTFTLLASSQDPMSQNTRRVDRSFGIAARSGSWDVEA